MPASRSVLVEARRLDGWLSRFEARNGPYVVLGRDASGASDASSVAVLASNGCRALLTPPLPLSSGLDGATGQDAVALLCAGIRPEPVVGLVLVRRGGYSVGVARSGRLLASKTGTRYVQSRTAAGGWSQQRFARRRANQADALVEGTAARAAALFATHSPTCLQLGGDRALAALTLGEAALVGFAHLPLTPFLTVPDPRLVVLEEAARSALSVRITVTDPPPGD